jgi:hypothetical protein
VPDNLKANWERDRIPYMILRNTTVDRKGP